MGRFSWWVSRAFCSPSDPHGLYPGSQGAGISLGSDHPLGSRHPLGSQAFLRTSGFLQAWASRRSCEDHIGGRGHSGLSRNVCFD